MQEYANKARVYSSRKSLVIDIRFPAAGRAPRSPHAEDHGAWEAAFAAENFTAFDAQPGDTYIVALREHVGKNILSGLVFMEDNGAGWPGNSNPAIKRYHGWRGTFNDIGLFAYGLRQLIDVETTGKRAKRVRITFGPDLAADED